MGTGGRGLQDSKSDFFSFFWGGGEQGELGVGGGCDFFFFFELAKNLNLKKNL